MAAATPLSQTWGRRGAVLAGVVVGLAVGAGGFTFWYGRGASYLTNDPAACANCHIMQRQYDGWLQASHRSAATCNDCHTPHNPIGKYYVKSKNGFWHSFYFTTGLFPEPIRITPGNRTVTEAACRQCHAEIAAVVDGPGDEPRNCLACHSTVGHRK
ncbi:MAG: cytochrome c nitrite reductase small subunit [Gemmatimonadota bacterium]|nr:cytochrome c nitrite reductase small subunit [Gemmatimonadota bacterium]